MIKFQKYQLWECVSRCQGFTVGTRYMVEVASGNGWDGIIIDDNLMLRNIKQHTKQFKLYQEAPEVKIVKKEQTSRHLRFPQETHYSCKAIVKGYE